MLLESKTEKFGLTPHLREMMMVVADGDPRVIHYLLELNKFKRVEDIIAWLCRNKLTGNNFIEWVKKEHFDSLLDVVSYILMKVDKDVQKRPIYLKDMK